MSETIAISEDQRAALTEILHDPEVRNRGISTLKDIVAQSVSLYLRLVVFEATLQAYPESKVKGRKTATGQRRRCVKDIKEYIGHSPTISDVKTILPMTESLSSETLEAISKDLAQLSTPKPRHPR